MMQEDMEPTRTTSEALLKVQEELIRREPIFHRQEFGTSREAFEAMTADDYWETGASGRHYSRDFIIDTVVKRYAENYQDEWRSNDFYCQMIAPNLYLLSYTLYQGERITRRATLWRYNNGQWLAQYHQGTIVEDADTRPPQ